MSTYLSLYEDHLSALIARGGSEAEVERAVDEYNKPRETRLLEWAQGAGLTCAYCDKPARVDEIKPTDEVTCEEHRA